MKKTAAAQQTIRKINQKLIVDIIRANKRITRAGISQILNLSPPSVSANIEKLVQSGLVCEYDDEVSPSPGRKGCLLGINRHFAHIVCVDLSGQQLKVGVSGLDEEVIVHRHFASIEGMDAHFIFEQIVSAISAVLAEADVPIEEVKTIVICTPGVIDPFTGRLHYTPQFKDWDSFNLKDALEEHYESQVVIKNDINVAALGELMWGAGKRSPSFAFINIDLGVGAGVVLGGKLYEGEGFAAGEIGYMLTSVEQLGEKPKFGHLESIISMPAIMANVARRMSCPKESITVAKLNELYKSGSMVAVQEMEYVTRLLAMCITNIASILNVPLVCIGGAINQLEVELIPRLNELINDMSPLPPRVEKSELGAKAFMQGAVYIGSEAIYDQILQK